MQLKASWRKVLSAESLQRSSQVLSVVDSTAYSYGGEIKPREPVPSDVHEVDLTSGQSPKVNTIRFSTESPTPRVGTASTVLNGKIYIFSGRGGVAMAPLEEHGTLWEFDPQQKKWSSMPVKGPETKYPAGRSYHAMASDGESKLFVHAGCPESGRLSDLWMFDTQAQEWTQLADAPPPARGGPSLAFTGGKLWRLNGFDGKTEQGGSLDVFDLATSTWSSIAYRPDGVEGPIARSVCCLLPVEIGERSLLVTMFGESDPSNLGHQGAGKMLSDVWAFDPNDESWSKVAVDGDSSPAPRGWFAADVFEKGTDSSLVVAGGLAESNTRLDDVWVLKFER